MAVDGGYGPKGYPKFDPLGAPELNVDDEAVGQYASLVGNRKVGTAAQRAALVSDTTAANQAWIGLEYYETDTQNTFLCTSISPLTWVKQAPAHFRQTGAAITGIGTPSGVLEVPGNLLTKHGTSRFFTTLAFGNEYAPAVVFDTPFPNAILGLSVTEVTTDSLTIPTNTPLTVDLVGAASFRVSYVGGSSVRQRAFLWSAWGY